MSWPRPDLNLRYRLERVHQCPTHLLPSPESAGAPIMSRCPWSAFFTVASVRASCFGANGHYESGARGERRHFGGGGTDIRPINCSAGSSAQGKGYARMLPGVVEDLVFGVAAANLNSRHRVRITRREKCTDPASNLVLVVFASFRSDVQANDAVPELDCGRSSSMSMWRPMKNSRMSRPISARRPSKGASSGDRTEDGRNAVARQQCGE